MADKSPCNEPTIATPLFALVTPDDKVLLHVHQWNNGDVVVTTKQQGHVFPFKDLHPSTEDL